MTEPHTTLRASLSTSVSSVESNVSAVVLCSLPTVAFFPCGRMHAQEMRMYPRTDFRSACRAEFLFRSGNKGHNAERWITPHGRRRNLRLDRGGTCCLGIIRPYVRERWN